MSGPDRTTLVDARWARNAGTTTFTRLLLRGLGEVDPPGRWSIWGPADFVGPLVWAGADHVPTAVDPVSWFGQRCAFRLPPADVVLHPHQTRPAHRLPAASCVLDLIQLQEPNTALRLAKTVRLRASVRAARVLFTIAASVRDQLVADYGVERASVMVLRLPVDAGAAGRVAAQREATPPGRYVLSVGRFDHHKNLPRLVEAFTATRFAAAGGRLRLVGGTAGQLRALGVATIPDAVEVLGAVDQTRLEDAMAGATALVQASLVEGYGLPVAEALLAGVPVASSPVPALTESGPAGVPTFDPRSVTAITEAIDEVVDLAEKGEYWTRVDRTSWAAARPTTRDLAEQVLAALSGLGR